MKCKLKPGRKHGKNKPGDVVELTDSQYMAWSDKFEPYNPEADALAAKQVKEMEEAKARAAQAAADAEATRHSAQQKPAQQAGQTQNAPQGQSSGQAST